MSWKPEIGNQAGIGLILQADIGKWLAALRRGLEDRQDPYAPLGAQRKMAIFSLKNVLAGSAFSRRILEDGWLAGQMRFPTHDGVLL